MKKYNFEIIVNVIKKELICGMRFKAAWIGMIMFAVTILACVSLALRGAVLEPSLQAAVFWIVIFFAAMAGTDRVFATEFDRGTILALKIYGNSQAVMAGKMIYEFLMLILLSSVILPLFVVLMDVNVNEPLLLILIMFLAMWGIAAGGTLIAAIVGESTVNGGIFAILLLPVMLPILLLAIMLTTDVFSGNGIFMNYLGGMAAYDVIITAMSSLLFDYLWYEG